MNYQYTVYSKIDDLPDDLFEKNHWEENHYLTPAFLKAMEACNQEEFRYFVLSENNEPKLFAVIRFVSIYLEKDVLPGSEDSLLRRVASCYAEKNNAKPPKFLVCGNVFLSGKHGYVLTKNANKAATLSGFTKALETYIETLDSSVKFILVKDFYNDSSVDQDVFLTNKYRAFQVDPMLKLDIDPEWSTIQDYLASMKTKYRTKAKKALKESQKLETKELDSNQIELLLPELERLYKNVCESTKFKMGTMNLQAYIDLKKQFDTDFKLKSYWLDDKLVGFMSGMIQQSELDAHYIGLDYDYNKKYYIYQRMLYDYVEMALENNVDTIRFGRTAGEMKSSVGAIPEELNCFLKHCNPIKNLLLQPIGKIIKPTEFKVIKPFKKQ